MANEKGKTALVAGGAGFIGSHLCDFLLANGYKVTALDNFVTGQKQNIEHIKSAQFEFVEHDICSPLPFKSGFDLIFNLASPASPMDFDRIPIEILLTASQGQKNCLDHVLKFGGRLLYASTSEIYGDPEVHPQVESYFGNVNTIGPRSCYDEAKRFGESITMAYHRKHKLQTRLVRIFNTHGPRMRLNDGRIIPNFFTQGLRNENLTIFGDGLQTRSFCYVSDLVEGLFAVIQSNDPLPFNLGNTDEKTVLQMAKLIREMTGNQKEIVFHGLPQNDPKKRKPDISRAKKVLGWEPKVSFEEGLKRSFEYFKMRVHD